MADELQHARIHRRRWARRALLSLGAIAVLAFCMNAWFVRRQEFVLWISPQFGARRAKVLVPAGWSGVTCLNDPGRHFFQIFPTDHRPGFLRWLLPEAEKGAKLDLVWEDAESGVFTLSAYSSRAKIEDGAVGTRTVLSLDGRTQVAVFYMRGDRRTMKRTYTIVCNSLRIE